MAHKGRIYEIDQELRFLSDQAPWPYWPAKRYVMNVYNWAGSEATLPLDVWEVTGDPIRSYPPFEYQMRAPMGTVASGLVECGLIFVIGDDTELTRSWFMCWVDGVEQLERVLEGPMPLSWGYGNSTTPGSSPTPGAVCYPYDWIEATAEPY